MILEGLHEKEIFTDNFPFRIAVNTMENFDYPAHWHNAVELIYIEGASCIVIVNNKEYTLSERDIFIIAPGDIHDFKVHSSKGRRHFIQFDASRLLGYSSSTEYKVYQYRSEVISCKDNDAVHVELENQIKKIIAEYSNMGFDCELFFNARFLDITVILSRNLLRSHSSVQHNSKTYELARLDNAFKYIDENYTNQISLADVSKAAGFSEYYFSRVFKKVTEKNFHNYLNEYRIKKVERLLFENVAIAQAAYESGFNSIVTFNRIFKQIKGCSPSEYLKKRI